MSVPNIRLRIMIFQIWYGRNLRNSKPTLSLAECLTGVVADSMTVLQQLQLYGRSMSADCGMTPVDL